MRTLVCIVAMICTGAATTGASATEVTNAANTASTAGTVVVIPASSELHVTNDEARLVFTAEEQDADAASAASRVNARMAKSTAYIRTVLPQAVLQTRTYSTFPVYADRPQPSDGAPPKVVAWRVAQSLDVRTTNLSALPGLVAKVQETLQLTSIGFELSPAALKKADAARITGALANLRERIASVAEGLGKPPRAAQLEKIEFEGASSMPHVPVMRSLQAAAPKSVTEPRFEAGETILPLSVIGTVRFP